MVAYLRFILILGCVCTSIASADESVWERFENTPYGLRYIKKNREIGQGGAIVSTMINLDTPQKIVSRGKAETINSMVFLEEFNCEALSRRTFKATSYSGRMGTGVVLHEVEYHHARPFVFSLQEWKDGGYKKLFCKRSWEFWR